MTPYLIETNILQNGYPKSLDDANLLKKLGVTHLLNLHLEYLDARSLEALGFKVVQIFVEDLAPMRQETACEIVDAMHDCVSQKDGRIYVHCDAGINRSPTAIWLYFLATGMSEEKAAKRIISANRMVSVPDPVLVMSLNLSQIKNRCV